MEQLDVLPIPIRLGVGFSSYKEIPIELVVGYRHEFVGRYHNYYFTKDNYQWINSVLQCEYVIDGFSPNLNKKLHVGHLRNLALANSLSKILGSLSKFVALLGKSLGVLDDSEFDLNEWFTFLDYYPEIYCDTDFLKYIDCLNLTDGEKDFVGCKVFTGEKGPVVIKRSNGIPTYAGYDLAFAKQVCPTHYITGAEQVDHFDSLGLKNKHIAMGLVLGKDKKKIKSRTGDAFSAKDAVQSVIDNLRITPEPRKLAWNVLCWNFLRVNKGHDVTFDEQKWTHDDAPGLYITYTYARLLKTLEGNFEQPYDPNLTQQDIELIGISEYYKHWLNKAIINLDTAPLANFVYDLARALGVAYHTETIVNGRKAWRFAVSYATKVLKQTMELLGMFTLTEV